MFLYWKPTIRILSVDFKSELVFILSLGSWNDVWKYWVEFNYMK